MSAAEDVLWATLQLEDLEAFHRLRAYNREGDPAEHRWRGIFLGSFIAGVRGFDNPPCGILNTRLPVNWREARTRGYAAGLALRRGVTPDDAI